MLSQDSLSATFAARLKLRMKELSLTQQNLSSLSGLSQSSLSRYLQSKGMPGGLELFNLSEALAISIDWLCGRGDLNQSIIKSDVNTKENINTNAVEKELNELKHSLRVVFRAMSEPQ